MTTIEQAESDLRQARAALNERRRATTDPNEDAALQREVNHISVELTRLALLTRIPRMS